MKNIAFIINPISGTQNKRRIPKLIDKLIDKQQWATDIVFTEYAKHATELAEQYAGLGFDAVVAVGGDGTVNEVASGLRHTNTSMGIIPIGSGNGFARHLGIPLRVNRAIEMLNRSESITVDYGMMGEQPFFCTCGTGFDAYIAEKFAQAGKRGFATYVEHIIRDFFHYESGHYRLVFNNMENGNKEEMETDAFLVTFANANQWGNAAYIAPKASMQDGMLDVAVLSKFPLRSVPSLALRLFEKSLDESLYMTTLHTDDITLYRESEGAFHFDGDPVTMPAEVNVRIVHDGLKVLVERRY
ncbi:MAG: YegS/Rv2252/BmrU family lipid kinase [Paludibacteraceae bacterium]|nr:YegS/Rv2252/BmrU family lipid kinase [Paludibacteraceae bacterium]